ncbi:hypothetical protein F0562_001280 [Nyssa sinensis]|uniref:Uncharacterized protein n=1 Tax=Nyssa sinensis TaxID=561372 RepID=A0A5J5C6U9_9ASTE|nr:hypothetical protein F0562_001280 [Nyssa sinensis]
MPPEVAKTCFQRWQSQASRASIASKDGRAKTSECTTSKTAFEEEPTAEINSKLQEQAAPARALFLWENPLSYTPPAVLCF